MKTRFLLILLTFFLSMSYTQAQQVQKVNVAQAGSLGSLLGSGKTTITDLTLTGTINSTDFATIKQMTALKNLDMSDVSIDNGAIPEYAFANKVLSRLVFPSTLKSIQSYAFNNTEIPNLDFSTCPDLDFINIAAFCNIKLQNKVIDLSKQDKVRFNGNGNYGTFTACPVDVILSDNKTRIEPYAFNSFNKAVNFPKKLLSIGEGGFYKSSLSHDIILPEGFESIDPSCFAFSTISRIVFPSTLKNIHNYAFNTTDVPDLDFSTCPDLDFINIAAFCNIKLQNKVIDLSKQDKVRFNGNGNYGTFTACPVNVILSDNKTRIEPYAFNSFNKAVNFPKKLLSIGEGGFYKSSLSHDIILPEGFESIDPSCFAFSTISRIVFPSTLKNIHNYAFNTTDVPDLDFSTCPDLDFINIAAFCNIKLQNKVIDLSKQDKVRFNGNGNYGTFTACPVDVILSDNKTRIEPYAFNSFNKAVNFPKKLVSIGEGGFYKSSLSHDIILPEGFESIDPSCFAFSTISRIVFPSTLKNIHNYAFNTTDVPDLDFSTCPDLDFINIAAFCNIKLQNKVIDLSKQDKVRFNGNGNYGTFTACPVDVILSEYKTTIEAYAFNGFAQFVNIPSLLKVIGEGAFWNAFIEEVSLPRSLTYIGNRAFSGCTELTKIISNNPTPPTLGSGVFSGVDVFSCQLLVPNKGLELYREANQWKDFLNTMRSVSGVRAIEVGHDEAEVGSVYPNPTTDVLNVRGENIKKISVYGLDGRIVKSVSNINTISLQDLSAGIYIVKITAPNGTVTERIVKK